MTALPSLAESPTDRRLIRVAAVAFINSRPLIYGLDRDDAIALTTAVPSGLLGLLESDAADVALLPTIDYQRLDGLRVVPASCIGCFGETLTVRLFCKTVPTNVRRVACDPDSHTSVALARVLFAKHWKTSPEFVDLRDATGAADEARLLIGDKVICEPPAGFPIQVDLGQAWREMTGLPFVFAIWCARPGVELGDVGRRLRDAMHAGLRDVDAIVQRDAVPRGWPAPIARRYLTEYLKFDVGPRQLEAIERFHREAESIGIIRSPRQPLRVEAIPGPTHVEL